MLKKAVAAVAFVGMASWVGLAQDAKSVIGAASAAIGVDQLRTVQYSATGFDFALGQSYSPDAPWPRFINKSYTRAIDFQTPASRVERVRLQGENPPRGGGQQPVRGEQSQTQTIIVDAKTPWVQQLEIWMLPHGFLRAAAQHNAAVKPQTVNGKRYNVVTFTGQNKAAVNGYINDQNLVERVETVIDNTVLGDMPFEAVYSDYKDFGGVKFPTRIVQRQGGHPVFDLTVGEVRPNVAVTIQPPQGRGGAPGGGGGGAAGAQAGATPSEKLADGVYLILGGYASVAVEFKDHLAIVESGQSDARGEAVIAEAKRLVPNKPIRYIVNTHHHFDHSSGLRTYMAQGATVVSHQANRDFLENVLFSPGMRTMMPDRFSTYYPYFSGGRRPLPIETVNQK